MFLNILMLTGLAGVAVPIVLHLLARARYRSVDWGAMMFLVDADPKQHHSMRLKQWILLMLRMAIIALLALGMARPVLSGYLRTISSAGHVDAAVVLDCSGSMAVEENGKSRIDLARRTAVSVISQLQRGDQVALIPAGSSSPAGRLSGDLQQTAQDAATATTSDGVADLAQALNNAAAVLEKSPGLNREIYVICDKQAVNWRQIDESFVVAWKHRWEDSATTPRVYVIPVGGEQRSNLALESFTAAALPAVARQPVEFEVRLHNFGIDPIPEAPLTVKDGDKELFRGSVTVPAEAQATFRFTALFDSPGCHVLRAQTRSSIMPTDDTRDLSVLVVPPLNVLVISGDERQGEFRKESDFLKLAIAPWATSGEAGPDPSKVTVITPAKWQRPDVTKWAVTILANIPVLTEGQARELEQYVYSGGGLVVTSGNLVQSENYNQQLFREGSGILPAKLGDSLSTQATSPMGIIGIDVNHAIFRFLRGRPDPVPNVSITRHIPIEWMTSDARQLITLSSGEPLLLDRPVGRGRVLLVTSTVDADWNTLPLSGLYLPMMQSMVRYLASAQLPPLNVGQGEPIVLNVEDIAEDRPKVKRPDGKSEEMEVRPSALSAELRYARTQQTGRYELALKTGREQRNWTFVVQPPAAESDLSSFDSRQMAKWRSMLGFELLDPQDDQIASAVGTNRKGRELWLPLIMAALGLMVVELWFSRRCG